MGAEEINCLDMDDCRNIFPSFFKLAVQGLAKKSNYLFRRITEGGLRPMKAQTVSSRARGLELKELKGAQYVPGGH